MRVKALRYVPSIGPPGTVKDIDAPSARALFVLGMAEEVKQSPEPEPIVKTEPEEKPKRRYRRKDMVAEDPVDVIVAPEPEPEPEDSDEATLRL